MSEESAGFQSPEKVAPGKPIFVIDRPSHRIKRAVALSTVPEALVAKPEQVPMADSSRVRLERMFNDHHDFIWRLLRRLGMNRDKVDDAAQHVFLVATERIESIKLGSERAFLFGIALRVSRMFLRTERRWVLDGEMDLRQSQAQRPEALAEQRRAVDLMDRVLSAMDFDLKTVFVLFEVEGMSTPEIAELVGIPLGTAASRLRRAREVFRTSVATIEREKTGAQVQP
jgi:RNA polymerase sigma-70 factor (ECF subfamily)